MTFKPGQSGNPGGRHRLPDKLRAIVPLSREEANRIISKYLRMTHEQIQEAIKDKSIPALEAAWCQQIAQAAYKGDGKALDRVMLWTLGPPREPVEDSSNNKVLLEKMTTAELLDVVRKSIPAAQDLPQLPTCKKED